MTKTELVRVLDKLVQRYRAWLAKAGRGHSVETVRTFVNAHYDGHGKVCGIERDSAIRHLRDSIV